MQQAYDVLVVGAGTAGLFFARKMADQGYSVLVADKLPEERQGERLGVFHIDQERFALHCVPEPRPGDEDYIGRFDYGITKSAFDHYPKRADYPFLLLRFAPFLKRLRAWAAEAGVDFAFGAQFLSFLRGQRSGRIAGALLRQGGEDVQVRARLVADCSGIPSAARRKLKGSRVEAFDITPRDMFYVVLHYAKLKHPEKDRVSFPTGYAQYKAWIGQTEDPDGCLFGIGANLSHDYADLCYQRFRAAIQVPEHEYLRTERGVTPYRRGPYSMADGGFICMGDAACMNKPFSGEGMTAGWVGCALAAEVAGKAMRNGAYPTEAALWEYSRRYARTQGADFAGLFAMLASAVDCTAEENEYEFEKDIVFTSRQLTRTNRTFSGAMPAGEALQLGVKAAAGVLTGKISLNSAKNLSRGVVFSALLQAHYRAFPETPAGFEAWAAKCDRLWARCGNIADVTEKCEMRNNT
ncbi:MAG: NAD(P)/FAD-dependent oxidoreductase [Oscillospiraceae bacterium]|jgi:flavin-dependent dehydrogenase|nr:NAD(P)/FAD-dependent oxidoreductase [Oscillospiraceae bacterium]